MIKNPLTTRARALRRVMTEPEWRLWHRLKGRALGGAKFLRQWPVGPYVADFCCREARLIVEIDGWTHGEPAEIAHDARRSAFLAAEGYRILRFQNAEVMDNLEGVLETILLDLRSE
jgi:very-short-patch-repair endonuclease